MDAFRKAGIAFDLLKRGELSSLAGAVLLRLAPRLPLWRKLKWKGGTRSEIRFWDDYIRTGGLDWPDDFRARLDPDLPLQARPAALLPPEGAVRLLDVGAGPLTYLGKRLPGRELSITAVDALADKYDRILEKYGVVPVVRTEKLDAERIGSRFPNNTFDLCFARNCLDHAYDPERAILQLIDVVKPGCYVLLEHHPNEAEHAGYDGLHQWNFGLSGAAEFLIGSRSRTVNMTRKYAHRGTISCELVEEGDGAMLVTRVLKRA